MASVLRCSPLNRALGLSRDWSKRLKTNYILIDFENVQPKNLSLLEGHPFKVMVFVGANQTKVPFDIATAMQNLGSSAQYIKIDGNGPNALDFHIAYYIGSISAVDQDCFFHIVSKDSGFDPLIKHLKSKKVLANRVKDVSEIQVLKISNTKSDSERISAVTEYLISRGVSKPRAVKTLSNSIRQLFMKQLEEKEVDHLVELLVEAKVVSVNGTKVSYNLPK
ncbi:PIN domain-containing protein [Vibrio diabolicus]|uniref:PIN domain-containing protein n=1 Tax=Vibrio diabolicus TaxID=50719 RepID=UPI0037501369